MKTFAKDMAGVQQHKKHCKIFIWNFCESKNTNTVHKCTLATGHHCGQTLYQLAKVYIEILAAIFLIHWGRVTHICVHSLTINVSDNSLSPGRRQAIIWTNAGILLIWPLGTNFSEVLIKIHTFPFKKMHLKLGPFCLSLIVLPHCSLGKVILVIIDLCTCIIFKCICM